MDIPRLIHQTWKTGAIPEPYRAWADSVRREHPDYAYRLWTDDDNRRLIRDDYPWFLETYDSYKHDIERADAARYFILLSHGGVYVDLDMEFLKPMEPLLAGGEIHFSLEAGPSIFNTVVSNAFMAAPKGHPFFRELTASLPGLRTNDVSFAGVFRNTGPDMLAAQCQRLGRRYRVHVIGLDAICPRGVLPQNRAVGFVDLQEIRARKLLFAIHHNTESWNTQLLCPDAAPEGYVLFRETDIPGFDIDFVESDGSCGSLADACSQNEDAIAFNFNGFLKGPGGKLEPSRGGGPWLKKGMVPWVCVKRDKVDRVR